MWKHHTIIPFVYAFYAFESPLFYNHCHCEGDVIIILFAMGTHQGDPLGGGALFALTIKRLIISLFCLFPSIIDDIHIIGPLQLYHLHMNISKTNSMR
jgi:hypothetical protein